MTKASSRKTPLALELQVVQTRTMDEQLDQVERNPDTFGVSACEQGTVDSALAREHDPVRAALEAAPWVPLTASEEAALEEIERNVVRWIPAGEFVAVLDPSAATTE